MTKRPKTLRGIKLFRNNQLFKTFASIEAAAMYCHQHKLVKGVVQFADDNKENIVMLNPPWTWQWYQRRG